MTSTSRKYDTEIKELQCKLEQMTAAADKASREVQALLTSQSKMAAKW
jgi:hypothetical protein